MTTQTANEIVAGVINNGLDLTELTVDQGFQANDSDASVVGSGDGILVDGDDATYITSSDGDLGYTIKMPPLVGWVDGSSLVLNIRMSVSGGIDPDDPDNLDADAQVFITTDADGDDDLGGFTDGTDEGVGFALTDVSGNPVDYSVPFNNDAWVDASLDDVITALEAGAYLSVIGVSNNNPDPDADAPVVNVYEMTLEVQNDTDGDMWLRPLDIDSAGYIEQSVIIDGDTADILTYAHTTTVDFKVLQHMFDDSADDSGTNARLADRTPQETYGPGLFQIEIVDGAPVLKLYDYDDTLGDELASAPIDLASWYTASIYWTWGHFNVQVVDLDTGVMVMSYEGTNSGYPLCYHKNWAVFFRDDTLLFELCVDNVGIQVHCNETAPVSG